MRDGRGKRPKQSRQWDSVQSSPGATELWVQNCGGHGGKRCLPGAAKAYQGLQNVVVDLYGSAIDLVIDRIVLFPFFVDFVDFC